MSAVSLVSTTVQAQLCDSMCSSAAVATLMRPTSALGAHGCIWDPAVATRETDRTGARQTMECCRYGGRVEVNILDCKCYQRNLFASSCGAHESRRWWPLKDP